MAAEVVSWNDVFGSEHVKMPLADADATRPSAALGQPGGR